MQEMAHISICHTSTFTVIQMEEVRSKSPSYLLDWTQLTDIDGVIG
jgi:hypothetical protein